jgi:hypothetical protein
MDEGRDKPGPGGDEQTGRCTMKHQILKLEGVDLATHVLRVANVGELVELRGNIENHTKHAYAGSMEWKYGKLRDYPTTKEAILRGRYDESILSITKDVKRKVSSALYARVAKRGMTPKRTRRFTPSSGEVDAERWVQGNPNFCCESKRGAKSKSIVIGINSWLSGGNSEKDFQKMAGTALGVIEALRSAGFAVQVDVVSYVLHDNGYHSVLRVPLLRTMDRMSYGSVLRIAAPGFSRDLLARLEIINRRGNPGDVDGNWSGRCLEIPPKILAHEKIDIYITKSWTDQGQEQIVQSITKKLRGFGEHKMEVEV